MLIVIACVAEIMYSPRLLDDVLEYVELYNSGSSKLSVDGFQIRNLYTFPPGSNIQSKGYVIVSRNKTEFLKCEFFFVFCFFVFFVFVFHKPHILDIIQT